MLLALLTLRIFGKAEWVNNLVVEHSSASFSDMIQAAAAGKTCPAGYLVESEGKKCGFFGFNF